ncbi:MAG: hypothetical protein L0Y72_30060 [Gemmataceae bacterium]|nr:hypothetical protein [Gemmataceae bacterium]MCI0743293.1 hypothetical protein [Gemmataceae bacterium]
MNIIERKTGAQVSGIIRPARSSDKILWTHWHEKLPPDAEDAHWEWDAFIDWSLLMPERFAAYALEAAGALQGLRLLEVSEDEVDVYGTHALRVSTAPWNRPPELRYKGAGSLLVGVAILRSLEDDHEGRVHCEALAESEAFHESNGMEVFDELSDEGLKRFRFSPEAAWDFIMRLEKDGLFHAGS